MKIFYADESSVGALGGWKAGCGALPCDSGSATLNMNGLCYFSLEPAGLAAQDGHTVVDNRVSLILHIVSDH